MELPPQIVKHQVRQLAASPDAPALRTGVGVQAAGQRLPVLQAFQEFLEIERRKARRRLIATGLVFLGLLLAVLVTASILYARLAGRVHAEVGQLERALAQARQETDALRGDGDAMRRALSDAQQAVDALRMRIEQDSARTAPIDLALFAATLDTLRRLQDLQPELSDWNRRLDALAREADALSELGRAHTERRMRWRADVRAWKSARAAQQTAQSEAERALAEALRAFEAAQKTSETGRSWMRRRKDAEQIPPPDPAPVWLALESLTQSKFALEPLRADLARLEREADAIQQGRKEAIRRSTVWREQAMELAAGLASWRERCALLAQEISARPPVM